MTKFTGPQNVIFDEQPEIGDHVKWVREQNARQPERKRLFDLVKDPEDWKAPIDAWINYAWNITPEQIGDAIVHFTATEPAFFHQTHGYRVVAVGYRKGPAGP